MVMKLCNFPIVVDFPVDIYSCIVPSIYPENIFLVFRGGGGIREKCATFSNPEVKWWCIIHRARDKNNVVLTTE